MLNKRQIIQLYNQFLVDNKIVNADFVIGAGGAMVMHGLREQTGDMDMDLPLNILQRFTKSRKYKHSEFRGNLIVSYDENIDLHKRETGIDTVIVDGVSCYSLEALLKQKEFLNRPKDQADIIKLKEAIEKRNK